eukprot:g3671.t1
MRDNDRSATYIVLVYLSLVVVDGLHQIGFFHCLSFGKVAAVTSGVNKAAQAVGLFIFSDMLFCGDDEDQCLNVWKLVGTVGVCICVLTYTGDKHIRSLLGYGDGDNSVKCTRAICERATEERDKHGMPVVSYTGLEEDSARSDDTGAGPAVAAVKRRDEIDFEDHDVKQLWNFISVLATVGGMEDFQRAMGITEIHYFDSLSELHAFPKRNLPSSEEFVPTLAFVGSDEHSELGGHFHFLRKTKEWSDSYKEVWQKGGTHGFCQIYAVMGALDEAGLLLPEQFSGKLKSGNGERRSRSSGHGHDISLESSAARHRIVETYDAQMSRNMLLALRFLQTKVTLIAQFWFQACIVLQEQTSEIMRHEYTTRIYGDWRLTGDEIYAYIDCIFALNGELFVNKWINDGLIFLPDDDDGEEDHSDHGVESNDDEEEDDDEKDSDDEHKEDADEETEEDKRDHEEEDADDEMEEVGGLEDDAWESPLL